MKLTAKEEATIKTVEQGVKDGKPGYRLLAEQWEMYRKLKENLIFSKREQ